MIIALSGKISSGKDTVAKIIQYLVAIDKHKDYTNNNFIDFTNLELGKQYQLSNWEVKRFAGKLKQIISLLTGIPVEDLEKQEVKDRVLGREWNKKIDVSNDMEALEFGIANGLGVPEKVMTVRELLQKLGTEALRDIIHPNVHINALFTDYKAIIPAGKTGLETDGSGFIPYPNWIISDLRFPNEVQAVKDRNGLCIRINRSRIIGGLNILEDGGIERYIIPEHYSETALNTFTEWNYTINNNGSIEELVEKVREILKTEKII